MDTVMLLTLFVPRKKRKKVAFKPMTCTTIVVVKGCKPHGYSIKLIIGQLLIPEPLLAVNFKTTEHAKCKIQFFFPL